MAAERVAIFLPDLGGGGAEQQVLTVARGLAADGLDVHLVIGAARGALLGAVPPGVTLHVLGASRILAALFPLVRWLRTHRPRALLATLEHANVVAVLAASLARARVRVVLREANVAPPDAAARRSPALGLAMRLAYPRAHAIAAVSGAVADAVAAGTGVARTSVHVVHNPVLDEAFARRLAEPVRDPWLTESPRGVPVVLGVGRLAAQKDFGTLIDAIALVARVRPVRLLVFGEGPDRAALEARIADRGLVEVVRLAGFETNPIPAMRAADVFVLPSRWEGLPGALVQAVAAGARIVATDCPGGSAEVLEGGALGELVPVGDAAAMAAAIVRRLEASAPVVPDAWRRRYAETAARAAYRTLLLGEDAR